MKPAPAPPSYSVEFLPLERRLTERRNLRQQHGFLRRDRRQLERRQLIAPS